MTDEKWLGRLRVLGRSQGFLSSAQVNDSMPLSLVDPEQLDGFVKRLEQAGILIVEHGPGSLP